MMVNSTTAARRSLLCFALVGVAAAAFGCSDTAVLLELSFNRKIPQDLDTVCLQVANRRQERFARRIGVTNLKATSPRLTVERGDGAPMDFEVLFRGEQAGMRVSESRLTLRFGDGEIRTEIVPVDPCGDQARGGSFVDGGLLLKEGNAVVLGVPATPTLGDLVLAVGPSQAKRFGQLPGGDQVFQLPEGLPGASGSKPIGALPINVMGGREDRDCDLDMLLLTEARPELWVQQDGVFERDSSVLVTGSWPAAVVADLELGGGVDIALGGPQGLLLLLGDRQGSATFRQVADTLPAGKTVSALAVGHLDDDRHPDLVIGIPGEGDVVLLNDAQGAAGFQSATFPGLTDGATETRALAVGDITGDDVPDVLRATDKGFEILEAQGQSFKPRALPSGLDYGGVSQILMEDLNNDCRVDVVLVRPAGSHVLYNLGGGALKVAEIKGNSNARGSSATVADVDGDGISDLVFAGETGAPDVGAYWVRQVP